MNVECCHSSKKQQHYKSFPAPTTSDFPLEKYQSAEEIFIKNHVKPTHLKMWNDGVSDWKALKKCDYQRLETVLEEEQLTSDETNLKSIEDLRNNNSEKRIQKLVTCRSHEKLIQKYHDGLVQSDSEKHNEEFAQKKQSGTNEGKSGDFFQQEIPLLKISHNRVGTRKLQTVEKKCWRSRRIAFRREEPIIYSLNRRNTFDSHPFHEKKRSSGPKNRSKMKIRMNFLLNKNSKYQKSSHIIKYLLILKLFNEEKKKLQDLLMYRCADSAVLEAIKDSQLRTEDFLALKVLCGVFLAFILIIIKVWIHQPPSIWRYTPSFFHRQRTYAPLFLAGFTKTIKKIFRVIVPSICAEEFY